MSKIFSFRISEEEYIELEKKSQQSGLTRGQIARIKIFGNNDPYQNIDQRLVDIQNDIYDIKEALKND